MLFDEPYPNKIKILIILLNYKNIFVSFIDAKKQVS